MTAAFERVDRETQGIDILVNNVWGGYERMVEDGAFTWAKPFWEQPLWRWDSMFSAGVRAHYHASQLAAKTMVAGKDEVSWFQLVTMRAARRRTHPTIEQNPPRRAFRVAGRRRCWPAPMRPRSTPDPPGGRPAAR